MQNVLEFFMSPNKGLAQPITRTNSAVKELRKP